VLAGRFEQWLHALSAASVGAAFELTVAIFISSAFVIATVYRYGYQIRALASFHFVLDRATSALCCLIGTVTSVSIGTTESSASRVADERLIRLSVDVSVSIRATDDVILFQDCAIASDLLHVDAERQCWTEWRFSALRNNQLTFLTCFRTSGHFARIATFADWTLGHVVDSESVITSQTAK